MISHARTLLLNRDGDKRPLPAFFGEEYVPSAFRALLIPSEMLTIMRALFGSAPDDAGMNYLLWQYMKILHSTEFEDYVYALDSRVTYLHSRSLLDQTFGATVDQNSDALQFHGEPGLGGTDGRLVERWEINQETPTTYSILNYKTTHKEFHTPAVVDEVTDFMPMTDHPTFQVRVLLSFATVERWGVEYLARPAETLDPVNRAAQLSNIGAEAQTFLFPNRDPYKLFKELYLIVVAIIAKGGEKEVGHGEHEDAPEKLA